MKRNADSLVLAVLALTMVVGSAYAQIIVSEPREFSAPNYVAVLDGWANADGFANLSHETTGGSPIGGGAPQSGNAYLGIQFNYNPVPSIQNPTINNASPGYIGTGGTGGGSLYAFANSGSDARIVFDFIGLTTAPTLGSAIRIVGTSGTWSQTFNYTQIGQWQQFSLYLDEPSWTLQSGSGTFLAALASVTQVELDIEGNVGMGGIQNFGLDNWMYAVPEPGTLYMLGAALLGLATTFRRQIQGGIEQLKKG